MRQHPDYQHKKFIRKIRDAFYQKTFLETREQPKKEKKRPPMLIFPVFTVHAPDITGKILPATT
jgi:hypothetical protein